MGNSQSNSTPETHFIPADDLLATGKYSDLTIRCGDLEVNVHRVVVCSFSKVFAAMFNHDCLEDRTRVINIDDSEPQIVSRMIQFLYTASYDNTKYTEIQKSSKEIPTKEPVLSTKDKRKLDGQELVTHVMVYIIADKYDIPKLKAFASEQYKQTAAAQWKSSFFTESIGLLYDNTMESDRVLKDIIIELVYEHRAALLSTDAFKKLLVYYSDVGIDMLQYSSRPVKKAEGEKTVD